MWGVFWIADSGVASGNFFIFLQGFVSVVSLKETET